MLLGKRMLLPELHSSRVAFVYVFSTKMRSMTSRVRKRFGVSDTPVDPYVLLAAGVLQMAGPAV